MSEISKLKKFSLITRYISVMEKLGILALLLSVPFRADGLGKAGEPGVDSEKSN